MRLNTNQRDFYTYRPPTKAFTRPRVFFQVVQSRYSSYSFRFVGGKAPSLVRSPGVGRGQGWICGGISGSGKTRYHHINSESN